MASLIEYQKSEILLGTNSFQEPSELSGVNAWVQQILHLLFMRKGTYPSMPTLGVDLPSYDYSFIDDTITKLTSEITEQVRTFFPDMPFDSVVLFTQDHPTKREKILIMVFNFTSAASNIQTAIVASTKAESRIDFNISI